jgi:hypothetical protein
MKSKMLMFISKLENTEVSVIIPTLAWIAQDKGFFFEAYLESERDGLLFAKTGSTVIGGNHFQQFNYLNAYYDISYVIYGEAGVFSSSIHTFGAEIIIQTNSIETMYKAVKEYFGVVRDTIVLFDSEFSTLGSRSRELISYYYPIILFEKGWGCIGKPQDFAGQDITYIEPLSDLAVVEDVSVKIAHSYEKKAKGVAFGDPDAILSMMATLCRDKYVSLYGPVKPKKQKDIDVSSYTETWTSVMDDIIDLAEKTQNNIIVGRQTGDGDIFELGRHGLCVNIMDPNRPAFPSVSTIPYQWANKGNGWNQDEPSDEQLIRYAEEGKILSSIIWHSGENAHNEAMVNLMELASFTGVKMGMGVHASRYKTCPQLWELFSVDRSQGGVKGLIEPILHSGGLGALKEIKAIAGIAGMPKGYMAFADTDLRTLTSTNDLLFEAVEKAGLEYFITSSYPGRNRMIYEGKSMIAFNQTPRNVCAGSPYVRMSVYEDIFEAEKVSPGWVIGTLDAPVVAFIPYIWNRGNRFMEIMNWLMHGDTINVLPHTISRYIRILKQMGFIDKLSK